MGVISLAAYKRSTDQTLTATETALGVLKPQVAQAQTATTWVSTVKDLRFNDSGLDIPEWQDIGCAVQFQGNGRPSVLAVGCVMQRRYGITDLHYEVLNSSGRVVVERDLLRVANTRFPLAGGSQVVAGRIFAHTFRAGTYTARLLTRTTHTNSEEVEATLTVHNASISVRNY